MSGRLYSGRPPASNRSHEAAPEGKPVLSQSSSQPAAPFDPFEGQTYEPATAAWKQEVNDRLAAHRTRKGGTQDARATPQESPRTASSRAAEAAARVAARYAKAPSYSELLAGEARAVVRAAGAAAEAARNAQAAAEAVLAGLETGQIVSGLGSRHGEAWQPTVPKAVKPTGQSMPGTPGAPVSTRSPVQGPVQGPVQSQVQSPVSSQARWQDEAPVEAQSENRMTPWAGAQPRWEEALPMPTAEAERDVWSEMRVYPSAEPGYSTGFAKDEGELFPYQPFDAGDPLGSATVNPVQHLPANLIEFPRELVATKKSRPRLAEGPHYDEARENPQLSIFEVDPELLAPPIYLSSASLDAVAPPEWASIELEHAREPIHEEAYAEPVVTHEAYAHGAASEEYSAEYGYEPEGVAEAYESEAYFEPYRPTGIGVADELPLEQLRVERRRSAASDALDALVQPESAAAVELLVAPVSDRMLATVVDGSLVMLAFVAASVVVIAATTHPPAGKLALVAAGVGLVLFWMLYQYLFLSYAEEGTLGMRYARIALCTFEDDNPTRKQMQGRIPAVLLSVLPAGLGLVWALMDKDRLCWHDKMTRTYQRKY